MSSGGAAMLDGRNQNGALRNRRRGRRHVKRLTTDVYCLAGNRQGFRTDTAISNSRFGNERTLQPWVPDPSDGIDGSLEASSSSGPWDQFAENERLFGLKTDYDENIYTTAINKNHPQYKERMAAAERKVREIERSAPVTAHVAEERIMDFVGGGSGGDNEEDKFVTSTPPFVFPHFLTYRVQIQRRAAAGIPPLAGWRS